eukprot:Gb_11501 [translate_table: standard]
MTIPDQDIKMDKEINVSNGEGISERGLVNESERVYIVSHRWWKAWEESAGRDVTSTASKEYTLYHSKPFGAALNMSKGSINFGSSDLIFGLCEESCVDPEFCETAVEGRYYVLLPEDVWRRVHNWYDTRTSATRVNLSACSSQEDLTADVYPLRLYLIAPSEGNQITVRISKKDNEGEPYRRACELFNIASEQVHIWDFFGQTKHALISDENKMFRDTGIQTDQDILLELQVDGIWPDCNVRSLHDNGSVGNELALVPVEPSRSGLFGTGGSMISSSTSRSSSPELLQSHPLSSPRNSDVAYGISNSVIKVGPLGLTGLHNLGNTCFMNSALQCLVHTPKLVEYFLEDYSKEINRQNPLGMDGELALAFGELLRKLWAPGRTPIPPRSFKSKLARFAPQFSGYNQHDSQELLAFLLDGLHEDLNRVKHKPYIESKDADGRPDEEVADEYWANHLARNDSIIVDVCQGQFKSTLVCPACNKISVTFDPFMYLSLPLPSTTTRAMTVTVFSSYGSAPPASYTVIVPKQGRLKDLVQAVSTACSLRNEEKLLLTEIYNHRIIRNLEESFEALSAIRDDDRLAAYRLLKVQEEAPLVELMHRRKDYFSAQSTGYWKPFGIPLVANLQDGVHTGADIQAIVQNLLAPMLRTKSLTSLTEIKVAKENGYKRGVGEDVQMEDAGNVLSLSNGTLDDNLESLLNPPDKTTPNGHSSCTSSSEPSFQLCLIDEKGSSKEVMLEADLPIPHTSRRVQVLIYWSEEMQDKYDTHYLDVLPEVFKPAFGTKRASQESISLYTCLEAFLKEEPLGPDDMWYCPRCKEHCQASKKLDLWRLPEILVVHLKRFSYSRFLKNKLETFVNFPTHDLDLTRYIAHKNGPQSNLYELYAVSNHYGSMGGGHYTAYVKLIEENRWYNFDDSHVSSVGEDRIKTSAAYVLFYRRIKPEDGSAGNGCQS